MRPLLMLLLVLPQLALANPSDLFDLDARGKGTAGASSVAYPLAWAAALQNPAGLASVERIVVGGGYAYGYMDLTVNGKDANVLDYRGVDLGVALPLPKLFGVKSVVGLTTHLPDQMVVRVQAIPASEPRFILLDNYPHRLQMGLGIGIALHPALHLGLGASVMMDLMGRAIHLNVGTQGGQKIGEMEMEASLPYRVVPHGGLLIDFGALTTHLKGTRMGLYYREPYSFRMKMNILADVDVAGIVTGDAIIALKMFDHYTPRKVSLGLSWNAGGAVSLYGGLDWFQWSAFDAGISLVKILVDLGVNPPLIEAILPDDNFHDTLSPKLGLAIQAGPIRFRGGYSFIPSPAPAQTGVSTLMDNDRHVAALGFTFAFTGPSFLPYPAKVHFAYQLHALTTKTAVKANPTLPSVQHGGSIHHASLGFEMEF